VFGAALVVFTHVIGSFGIPAILGARMPVLAVKAYNEFVSELGGNPQMQTIMAFALVMLGVAMLVLQKLWIEAAAIPDGVGQGSGARSRCRDPWALAAAFAVFRRGGAVAPAGDHRRHHRVHAGEGPGA
jgi:iron(III) transport system permease protein